MSEFKYLSPSTERGVVVLSVTATAARFAIPTVLAGRVCEVMSDGADADILFGGSGVTCVYGQASTVASEAITVHASSGGHLVNKVGVLLRFPKSTEITHFSVDCVGAGSAKLYIQAVD